MLVIYTASVGLILLNFLTLVYTMNLIATLKSLRPGENVVVDFGKDDTMANVVWMSQRTYSFTSNVSGMDVIWNEEANVYTEAPFTIPTQVECEEYWNSTLKNQVALESLRRKRDTKLEKTDKYVTIDYPHATEETKQAWLDYRQALRDLPANTTDPENPVWPEAPN